MRNLTSEGFDGLDVDWEYPGAPDRGGKPEDTDNFVKLVETLRKTFDGSGNKYGLTFTAPSSYWYLRWFDLPRLAEHVDWINLMTYDLHGVVSRVSISFLPYAYTAYACGFIRYFPAQTSLSVDDCLFTLRRFCPVP